MLLLLDNLEQVVDCAPGSRQLLGACPNLTLLVTRRELLRISGEVEYPVPPLAEPESRLALLRARADRAVRARSPSSARASTRCRSHVELAAAPHESALPGADPRAPLQRLDLLRAAATPIRASRRCRATIEWSYELLSRRSSELFARLSVFAGGCTLEAAEEVPGPTLDTLQSLVEKSLLRFTARREALLDAGDDSRVRGRAARESEDGEELALRHSECFLVLGVESAEDQLLTAEPGMVQTSRGRARQHSSRCSTGAHERAGDRSSDRRGPLVLLGHGPNVTEQAPHR